MSASSIKNYRDIASRPDCLPYFHLGVGRVLKLISLTRKEKGDERIRMFLVKQDVVYDPSQPLASEMKAKIGVIMADAAKKPERPVSVDKLGDILKKHADEFVKASDEAIGCLDEGKKGRLADILRELVKKLTS